MDDLRLKKVETRLRETAADFHYPPLPDISSRVLPRLNPNSATKTSHKQRLTWALVVILAVAVGLLAVPPVRAQFLEFLQVGAVRISLVAPAVSPDHNHASRNAHSRCFLVPCSRGHCRRDRLAHFARASALSNPPACLPSRPGRARPGLPARYGRTAGRLGLDGAPPTRSGADQPALNRSWLLCCGEIDAAHGRDGRGQWANRGLGGRPVYSEFKEWCCG
jgi:hypothetical protein